MPEESEKKEKAKKTEKTEKREKAEKTEKDGAEKPGRTHWHQAFVAALKMEFEENENGLEFKAEHGLNQMPLLIDCLVIKKRADLAIKNEIGRHFRTYNVIEYKSPRDALNIDVVSKVQAYAHLFKAYAKRVDAIKFDDITVTLIRDAKPRALFKYFEENGYKVTNPGNGIYYVEGNLTFPMQIIVGRELSPEDHKWLRLLTCRATELDLAEAVGSLKRARLPKRKELIKSILNASVSANREAFAKLSGRDGEMVDALMEFLEPEITKIVSRETERVERETAERVERETTKRVERETAKRVERETAKRVERETTKRVADRVEREITKRVMKETTERVEKEMSESAIRTAIAMLRDMNIGDAEIEKAIKKSYGISEQEARAYLQ